MLTPEQSQLNLREYLDNVYSQERQFAEGTIKALQAACNQFVAFNPAPIGKLTSENLADFLRLPGHAPSTKAKMKDLLRAMFRRAGIFTEAKRQMADRNGSIGFTKFLAADTPRPPGKVAKKLKPEHAGLRPSQYLADVYRHERELAQGAFDAMDATLEQFERFNGGKTLGELNDDDVENYVRYLWQENYARTTIGVRESHVLAVLRYSGVVSKVTLEAQPDDGLWTVCERDYFPRNLRIRSEQTRMQYKYAIREFGMCLGHTATVDDLSDDNVVMFLKWTLEQGVSASTANNRAERIKALWNWLGRRGVVSTFPTANSLDESETVPLAWSKEELMRLFKACDFMERNVGGVPAHLWWRAWLLWLWNTGARFGESQELTWDMVDIDHLLVVIPAANRKGRKKTATYRLWPDTIAAMRRVRVQGRATVFKPERTKTCMSQKFWSSFYYSQFDKLLKLAGLPGGRRRKTQSMRVSHATWLAASGANATQSLMHSDPATTQKHYLDQRFLIGEAPALFKPEAEPQPEPAPRFAKMTEMLEGGF